MINWYEKYPQEDITLVEEYLRERYEKKYVKPQINIVYDLLHLCDINCRGCGTNAVMCDGREMNIKKPSLSDIEKVLLKIKRYVDQRKLPIFINFGGGEPFLRKDMIQVLMLASEIFSPQSIGVDTNGTLENSSELIIQAADYCSYIGISVNGLRDYSKWWTRNEKINVYERQIQLLRDLNLLFYKELAEKIEVTSVATKMNLNEIPALMEQLKNVGVKNYSVHRSIPVGRMKELSELVPSARDYFELLIQIIKKSKQIQMDCHMHHSIESIHTTLLLGIDTYKSDQIGNPDISSSIGIEPRGEIVYDPWCTTGYWKELSAGNLIDSEKPLYEMVHSDDSFFEKAKRVINRQSRCNGCAHPCSGGSRIVAAVDSLNRQVEAKVSIEDLIQAMSSVDPGCPLKEIEG